jgi:hypothetical protein
MISNTRYLTRYRVRSIDPSRDGQGCRARCRTPWVTRSNRIKGIRFSSHIRRNRRKGNRTLPFLTDPISHANDCASYSIWVSPRRRAPDHPTDNERDKKSPKDARRARLERRRSQGHNSRIRQRQTTLFDALGITAEIYESLIRRAQRLRSLYQL